MSQINIHRINVHAFKTIYDQTKELCLIDVREIEEWQTRHVPRAMHIPKNTLADKIARIVPNKKTPIYLMCQGGVRSLYGAEILTTLGYEEVYSIDGGLQEWEQAQYPTDFTVIYPNS